MFQTFDSTASPDQGPPRLAALRAALSQAGVQGFLVPRADAHQGEYVAARDERLAWLTGFTGSAGFCIVLPGIAGVFVDGRYRVQVKAQVAADFTPVNWPEVKPGEWIRANLDVGMVGFDPWLHTAEDIAKLETELEGSGVTLLPVNNFVDSIWTGQPRPPVGKAFAHPMELAGRSHPEKRSDLAAVLREAGQKAAVLTLPDSLCWLLNIRGADVPRNPVLHGFALLRDDASVDLHADPVKFDAGVRAHLGPEVRLQPPEGFTPALAALTGPVRVDRASAPLAVSQALEQAGVKVVWGDDPCRLPKACKHPAEIAGTREAHLRDGAAVTEFLAWLDRPHSRLTEIAAVRALEGFRRATNALHDISFDTIAGSGPHGAVIHYRVTEATDREVRPGELLLVDSGAQYLDGTTDITRTVAIGPAGELERTAYTLVLKGMIAISRTRFPKGLAGRDLDALARQHLWAEGMDYDHGTGHGVGVFLSVHEGPQRLSRLSDVPLQPGMILSNEPGYYREGEFGIRLENLIVVEEAPKLADDRVQYRFGTLTFAPFDRRLIRTDRLSPDERDWLNAYHAEVIEKIGPRLSDAARDWLSRAAAPV